jgi:hypothetical protein
MKCPEVSGSDTGRTDEKAQRPWAYVNILKKIATPQQGVRCILEMDALEIGAIGL